jgi:hypothetical protein
MMGLYKKIRKNVEKVSSVVFASLCQRLRKPQAKIKIKSKASRAKPRSRIERHRHLFPVCFTLRLGVFARKLIFDFLM